MRNTIFSLFFLTFGAAVCSSTDINISQKTPRLTSLEKLSITLSAFGVESDGFPYIAATVDFKNNSSLCEVSYDNPKFKDSTYSLSPKEIDSIKILLSKYNLSDLKKEYKVGMSDQPTAITTIYMMEDTLQIRDYGLQGETPLPELYKIILKLDKNYR